MKQSLALQYRPRRFRDVTGQRATRLVLEMMVKRDTVPPGLLFKGIRGTGKTTMARILASALNCSSDDKPCTECPSCVATMQGNSLSVMELDAASNGRVEDVRDVIDMLRYSVSEKYRVLILDEAHMVTPQGFNALLKTLEEPPPNTVFIFCTTEPNKIIETILSRLLSFEFRHISTEDIISRLTYVCEQENFSVTPELLTTIADRARGGMRDAIMTLDQATRVGIKTPEEFAMLLGEEDFAPEVVRSMLEGDLAKALSVLDKQLMRIGDPGLISSQLAACLRDLLVLHSGGTLYLQGKPMAERQALLGRMPADKVFAVMKVLWDLKTKVKSIDPRSDLELALVMAIQTVSSKFSAAPAAPAAPTGKLSLAQLRGAV